MKYPHDRSRSRAGFVLAGGRSSRMGRDKALLPYPAGSGTTLVEFVASRVRQAAGSAIVIGSKASYGHLGLQVVEDRIADRGPLGGLWTALSSTDAEWCLLVACDMPLITSELLTGLLDAAQPGDEAVVAEAGGRLHPLCAAYHRSLKARAEQAILNHHLKMHDFLASLRVRTYPAPEPDQLANANDLKEWERLSQHKLAKLA